MAAALFQLPCHDRQRVPELILRFTAVAHCTEIYKQAAACLPYHQLQQPALAVCSCGLRRALWQLVLLTCCAVPPRLLVLIAPARTLPAFEAIYSVVSGCRSASCTDSTLRWPPRRSTSTLTVSPTLQPSRMSVGEGQGGR